MSVTDDNERPEGKICRVCGDQALGYNFNAVSCESCKAFFRRNALKNKELRCPFKQSCEITAVTRKFCQRCRLAKCYRAGMKRELIMTDEDKQRKKRKIMANKAKSMKETFGNLTANIGTQTDCLCSCRCFSHDWPSPGSSNCDTIEKSPRTLLSSNDQEMLENLIIANKALEAPVDHEIGTLPGEEIKSCGSQSLLDVINLTALAIKRLIRMCKKINGFKILCQEDQLQLLKQGCTQMMLLRGVVNFDPDKNSWKIPHSVDQTSQIKVEILKEARGNLYEAHEKFLRSFDARASKDLNIMYILTAVALFDPNRPNLVQKNAITELQEDYYRLLKEYLNSKFNIADSKEIFNNLIFKMTELEKLMEDHVRVYLNVNPSLVEPLLIEIFDLKQH